MIATFGVIFGVISLLILAILLGLALSVLTDYSEVRPDAVGWRTVFKRRRTK